MTPAPTTTHSTSSIMSPWLYPTEYSQKDRAYSPFGRVTVCRPLTMLSDGHNLIHLVTFIEHLPSWTPCRAAGSPMPRRRAKKRGKQCTGLIANRWLPSSFARGVLRAALRHASHPPKVRSRQLTAQR